MPPAQAPPPYQRQPSAGCPTIHFQPPRRRAKSRAASPLSVRPSPLALNGHSRVQSEWSLVPKGDKKRGRHAGGIDGLGLNKGWFRGVGMPLSPMLHSSIDLQARCSKQVAEEPLVLLRGGVQQSDALPQSDMLLESVDISRCSLGEQIAPEFPSAMPSDVPSLSVLMVLMGYDAKWILYLGAYMRRLLRCTLQKRSLALSDLDL